MCELNASMCAEASGGWKEVVSLVKGSQPWGPLHGKSLGVIRGKDNRGRLSH